MGRASEPVPLPPELIDLLRPGLTERAGRGGLAGEIVAEIRRAVPEFARLNADGLHRRVGETLDSFMERVVRPGTEGPPACADLCRSVGRGEAYAGRSMDSLQAAYRVGLQVSWRRLMRIGDHHRFPSAVMSSLAETLFAYIDELIAFSLEGYVAATERPAEGRAAKRKRLLRLILERPAVPFATISELAEAGGWPVPEAVTPVALQPGSRCVEEALDSDVLAEFEGGKPHLLVPGPLDEGRRSMLKAVVGGHRVAAGLTVPLNAAADSLRWSRQVLSLANAGIIEDGSLTLSEDHLMTLWLLSDPALIDQVTRRSLGVLEGMTRWQRRRMTETLGAWLEARGNAVEVAERLNVHPQTVRYRMRQIRETFGDQIDDPDARFELELAVRAVRLRELRPHPTAALPPPASAAPVVPVSVGATAIAVRPVSSPSLDVADSAAPNGGRNPEKTASRLHRVPSR